ncbi:MAG: glycerophosphodiester phosphodiesterase family protein [Oscillospiraceae bacterium]
MEKSATQKINSTLDALLAEKKVLVAVHRGAWGGNIVENTIPPAGCAGRWAATSSECDVASSTDGVLYAFHDGTERRNLNRSDNIKTMSSQEVDSLVYNNSIYEPSGVHVERFEDIVRYFCHGEIFNIDRAWDIPAPADRRSRQIPAARCARPSSRRASCPSSSSSSTTTRRSTCAPAHRLTA